LRPRRPARSEGLYRKISIIGSQALSTTAIRAASAESSATKKFDHSGVSMADAA